MCTGRLTHTLSNTEIEVTLAICSEAPAEAADQVAALESVGRYRLLARDQLSIHDVYLDMADQSLRSVGLGLRVRKLGGGQLITIKGKASQVAGGGRSREETELPWSAEALAVLVDRAAAHGLALQPAGEHAEPGDAVVFLRSMGFFADHTRDNRRRPRDVVELSNPSSVVAELVIDSVVYHLDAGPVRHHEIEIEVKGEGTVEIVQDLAAHLEKRWPCQLRTWNYGKRSTGSAAERLLGERGREGLLSDFGDLKPVAYDLMESYLR